MTTLKSIKRRDYNPKEAIKREQELVKVNLSSVRNKVNEEAKGLLDLLEAKMNEIVKIHLSRR